jgi:hypothetical protein
VTVHLPKQQFETSDMAKVMKHNVTFQSFKLDEYRTHIDNSMKMAMAEAIKDNAILRVGCSLHTSRQLERPANGRGDQAQCDRQEQLSSLTCMQEKEEQYAPFHRTLRH